MRRMEKITGRTDDMIILRGVNLFPTQIEEIVLGLPALSPHFQCHLDRTRQPRRRSPCGSSGASTPRPTRRTPPAPSCAQRIKDRIGVSVGVDVVDVASIERSVGKMRRIVDHRPAR